MLDVDRFKRINDRFGHSAGDQVLRGIVDRCSRLIRHVDVLGRYGGDEFAMLLPEADRQLAADIANRIRTSVAALPFHTDAGDIAVTISMGVAETLPDSSDVSVLLDKADQALYRSKEAGRNTVTLAEE
jgi:diguanylate cyclase (GGDEF)-like protein